jgi:arylsulfatase A-like enzyme
MLAAAAASMALSASWNGALAAAKRPNVLLIICDDMNHYVLHRNGLPPVKTPHLDRLAEQGVTFTNMHTVMPMCGPSRACLWTGIYPQQHGNYNVWQWDSVPLLKDSVPLQQHLLNNGYEVYGTGKLFHEGAGGRFYTAYEFPPNYGPWPWKGKGNEEFTAHPAQLPLLVPYLSEDVQWDVNFGPLSNVPRWKPDPSKDIPGYTGWRSNGMPFRYASDDDRQPMPDEIAAEFAIAVLRQTPHKPFFLGVGFMRPHTPLYAPKKYFDMFPIESVRLPPYLKNDLDDCAATLRQLEPGGFQHFHAVLSAGGERMWKQWLQAYLACTAFADEQIGKVLQALDESPYRDNTLVIVTSDNGYHIGEKDVLQKMRLWEESTNVPLFVRGPGAARGKVCNQPVSLIDLYPTLIDLCGLPPTPNAGRSGAPLGGHTLRPLFEDPEHGHRDGLPVALTVMHGPPGGPHFSIRSERYRYTLCSNGEEELYDHAADPNEWTNLAGRLDGNYPAVKRELRKTLTDLVRSTQPAKP